jgi:hypothetical protein
MVAAGHRLGLSLQRIDVGSRSRRTVRDVRLSGSRVHGQPLSLSPARKRHPLTPPSPALAHRIKRCFTSAIRKSAHQELSMEVNKLADRVKYRNPVHVIGSPPHHGHQWGSMLKATIYLRRSVFSLRLRWNAGAGCARKPVALKMCR